MKIFLLIIVMILSFSLVMTSFEEEEQMEEFQEKSDSMEIKINSILEDLYYSDSLLREYRQAYDSCSMMNSRLVDYFHILIDNANKERRAK